MRLCRCIIRFIGYDNRENLKLFHQVSKCRTLSAAHLLQFDKLQIVLKKQRTGNDLGLVLYKTIAAIFAKIFNQFHGIYLTYVCIRFQVAAFPHFRDASIPISVRLVLPEPHFRIWYFRAEHTQKSLEFIWAPKCTKGGGTCHHWDRLMNVREGDIIFHCADGYIQAISRAKGSCMDSARPDKTSGDWTMWEKDGRRVDCEYHQLKKPIKHGAYKETIIKYCGVKYAPFDKDGNGNMGYLFDLNKELAAFFMNEIIKKNPEVVDLDYVKFLLV